MNEISKIEQEICANADFSSLRNFLQVIFNEILFESKENSENELKYAFSVLQKINNIDFDNNSPFFLCNITELAENLAFCCDAAICETDKRVIFMCEEDDLFATIQPKALTRAILEIIAFAIKSTTDRYISIYLHEENGKAIFTVEYVGSIDISDTLQQMKSLGNSLNYIYHIIYAHFGNVFICSSSNKSTLVFTLPLCYENNIESYSIPKIEDLLFDRLSVLYEALY